MVCKGNTILSFLPAPILFALATLSCQINAQTQALHPSPFSYISNVTSVRNLVEIANMPAIFSQGPVGSCFGCAPATIVQKFLCDNEASYKVEGLSCDRLPAQMVVSQFSMIAWADTNEPKGLTLESNQNNRLIHGDPANHQNIKIYEDTTIFSSSHNAIINSLDAFSFMPDSCFPTSRLESKYGSKSPNSFRQAYEESKILYRQERASLAQGKPFCVKCHEKFGHLYNTKFEQAAVKDALKRETFSEFLYSLIFYNCKPIMTFTTPSMETLPIGKIEKSAALSRIVTVLDSGKPMVVANLCIELAGDGRKCLTTHSTVISGYRTACSLSKCEMQLQVRNCWGADWQQANNNGWFRADSFIHNLNLGEKWIDGQTVIWLK